jgi:hypothetical protein
MDIRVIGILLALIVVMAAGIVVVQGLVWLLDRLDPVRPLQEKEAARYGQSRPRSKPSGLA